jgi:carbonic anhydrase
MSSITNGNHCDWSVSGQLLLDFFDSYALELHMVHHEKRFETITKAATEKNGIAVLGILFHVAADDNPMIENFLENAGTVFQTVGKNQTYKEKLLLDNLLPKDKGSFFRYEGSLTTPGCGEAVIWTVFEKSIPISMEQVRKAGNFRTTKQHNKLLCGFPIPRRNLKLLLLTFKTLKNF